MPIIFINMNGIPKRKLSFISICVHLNQESRDTPTTDSNSLQPDRNVVDQHYTLQARERRVESYRASQVQVSELNNRLRPSDRLVLIALCAKVPEGTSITPPVRVRELMEECSISRKQVQICLKRLGEKRMISRITKGVTVGSQEGYRYRILWRTDRFISKGA